MTAPVLAWTEHVLPGRDLGERIASARAHGLALEIANRPDTDFAELRRSGLPIVTLQAYGMHEAHPLHPDPRAREAGLRHLRETIELAASLRTARVLAVCGYGAHLCERPFESCREFFGSIVPIARSLGVRVLVEPLSPLRAAAMTDSSDVERLLDETDAPDVLGLALDTGHALDGGHDVEPWLAAWRHPVEELQVRWAGSRPPPSDVPLSRWLSRIRSHPSVVCVEYRGAIGSRELADLVLRLRSELDLAQEDPRRETR